MVTIIWIIFFTFGAKNILEGAFIFSGWRSLDVHPRLAVELGLAFTRLRGQTFRLEIVEFRFPHFCFYFQGEEAREKFVARKLKGRTWKRESNKCKTCVNSDIEKPFRKIYHEKLLLRHYFLLPEDIPQSSQRTSEDLNLEIKWSLLKVCSLQVNWKVGNRKRQEEGNLRCVQLCNCASSRNLFLCTTFISPLQCTWVDHSEEGTIAI